VERREGGREEEDESEGEGVEEGEEGHSTAAVLLSQLNSGAVRRGVSGM
jgi:hypothetical protein